MLCSSCQQMGSINEGVSDRAVSIKASHSLFFVEITPRYLLKEEKLNCLTKYRQLTAAVKISECKRKVEPSADAITAGTEQRFSTGFAIAVKGKTLRILTCAHSLEDTFTSSMHRTNPEDINELFRFDVHCIHHECEVVQKRSRMKISNRKRDITPAWVVAIDTKLDLLVLEIDVDELHGNSEKICTSEHPPIKLSESDPTELTRLTLIGWPSQRCNSLATGQVSHCGWTYDSVSSLNIKGYAMDFLEIHGMVGTNGFSGGPIINNECECVALYHGVFNEAMGYGVGLDNLRAFLDKHKVVNIENLSLIFF